MKKYVLLLITPLLFVGNFAFASITISPTSPQLITTPSYSLSVTTGDRVLIYGTDGTLFGYTPINSGNPQHRSAETGVGTETFVECDSTIALAVCSGADGADSTIALAESDTGYISKRTFTWVKDFPPSGTGISILGGHTNGTGGLPLTSNDLTANVASALQTTGDGLFPIVALVIGIFLAMGIIKTIANMFKLSDQQKKYEKTLKTEKPLRQKTALYNKDGRFAGFRFDD